MPARRRRRGRAPRGEQSMPVRLDAPHLARCRSPVRPAASTPAHASGTRSPGFEVPRAAHDLERVGPSPTSTSTCGSCRRWGWASIVRTRGDDDAVEPLRRRWSIALDHHARGRRRCRRSAPGRRANGAKSRSQDEDETGTSIGTLRTAAMKRMSLSPRIRMSAMALRIWARRSMPNPKAKPVYSSGSMPTARNTLGCTMPQPPSSIQPVLEHVRQPAPRQMTQVISNSADGSVNGNDAGRSRDCIAGTEVGLGELLDGAGQVAEGDAPVDDEPLDLAEGRAGGGRRACPCGTRGPA